MGIKNILKKLFGVEVDSSLPRRVSNRSSSSELQPKIHVGCGPIDLEGWINIDARSAPHVHITTDHITLDSFKDGTVGEIYLCHVLEHFDFEETRNVLKIFHDKLKPGGILRISVPDFRVMAESYLKGAPLVQIKYALMGGQDYQYNYHKSVYDHAELVSILRVAGFSEVMAYDTVSDFGTDLTDWSTGKVGDVNISLNLKAYKST